jgi:ABC-type glycerol-3-phosphate transport system substrate-binding protein
MGKGPPGGWNIMFGLYGAGLSFVDLKTKKAPFAAPGAAREKAIKEAKFWYDLIHKYKVIPPGASAIGFTEWYEMYARGQGAMFYGWVGDWYDRITSPEIVAKIGESGTCVRPTQIPEGTYYTSMWGYGIPKTCKNPEAAWALIKWLISEDIQLAMSRESGQASPLVKYTEKAIEKGWVAEALRTELKRGRLPQKFIQCPAVVSLYWTYASELYAGGLTPEEFVDKIAKETEKIMR